MFTFFFKNSWVNYYISHYDINIIFTFDQNYVK